MNIMLGDCVDMLGRLDENSVDSLVTDPPAGISFMGKAWDKDRGGRAEWVAWMTSVMRECYRVLKPGAHGLVWALPRTSHWTATALDDAGFEIRDVVTHLFGTGFPKSLDVSKAIDKAAGAEREVLGRRTGGAGKLMEERPWNQADDYDKTIAITTPATDDAKRWQGFGTALKPASEHWILVRKPCSEKTVAANVLKWGTGAINVDGCRIGTETISTHGNGDKLARMKTGASEGIGEYREHVGRFPANLVLDEEAAAMLDEQSGLASRFFYVAKASKSDRGVDNKHPTVKSTKLMAYLCRLVTPPGGTVLDPFMGSGSTGVAALAEGFQFVGIERDQEYFKIAEGRLK